jgi:antirestriction protein ArdC
MDLRGAPSSATRSRLRETAQLRSVRSPLGKVSGGAGLLRHNLEGEAIMSTNKSDIYTRVTDTIIAHMEKGTRPWVKPWSEGKGATGMPLRHNGIAYRGINVLMLLGEAQAKGFSSPTWMTFRQATELGGHVRKGEKGSLVVFASKLSRTEEDEITGEEQERDIPFLKGYTVFNLEQIDGLSGKYEPSPAAPLDLSSRKWNVETFIHASGASVRHGGHRAYYSSDRDIIQMPPFEAFIDAETYYATLVHELVHWTMPKHRLDRDFGKKSWGDEGYAMEELVAELGAAFLCITQQVTPDVREDHAAYIESWLKVLKRDKRAIFTAASHAQLAVDYLEAQAKKSSAP